MPSNPGFRLGRLPRAFDPRVPHMSALLAGRVLPPPPVTADWTGPLPADLIADRFEDAVAALEQGIARNPANPAMNADTRLIINRVRKTSSSSQSNEAVSSAHLLLQRFDSRATKL